MKVSFQGEPGAYSEQAVFNYYGEVKTIPCESFDAMFEMVTSGKSDAALAPIENSLAGSIHQNYDLLLRHDLHIVAARTKAEGTLFELPAIGLREDDLCFSAAKLFFAYGLGNALSFPLTVGATVLAVGLVSPVMGMLSDALGRRGILCISMFAMTVPTALIPMAHSLDALIALRFLQGLAVPGATVTLTNEANKFTRNIVTDARGSYYFGAVPVHAFSRRDVFRALVPPPATSCGGPAAPTAAAP